MPIERSNVPGLAQPPGYTHLATVREARLVFIAGQVPLNERGELVGHGDAITQVRQCLRNLAACLAAAGATPGDVVRTTVYVAAEERRCWSACGRRCSTRSHRRWCARRRRCWAFAISAMRVSLAGDRDQASRLPPDVRDWLPANHLAAHEPRMLIRVNARNAQSAPSVAAAIASALLVPSSDRPQPAPRPRACSGRPRRGVGR